MHICELLWPPCEARDEKEPLRERVWALRSPPCRISKSGLMQKILFPNDASLGSLLRRQDGFAEVDTLVPNTASWERGDARFVGLINDYMYLSCVFRFRKIGSIDRQPASFGVPILRISLPTSLRIFPLYISSLR